MRLSFRASRNLGFAIILSIVVFISIFSYRAMSINAERIVEIIVIEEEKLKRWYELSQIMISARDRFYDYMLGGDEVISRADLLIRMALDKVKEIKELSSEAELEDVGIEGLIKEIKTFRQAIYIYASEVKQGYRGGASANQMEKIALKAASSMMRYGGAAVEYIGIVISEKNKDSLRLINISQKVLGLGLILAVILMITVAVLMGRALSRPVRQLVEAVNEVTGGRLDKRIKIESQDEIGYLSSAFNKMVEKIRSNYQNHAVNTSLLSLSLVNTLFDEFLRRALNIVLSLPLLADGPKRGAIFLIDENEPEVLVLRAQYNMPDATLESCYKVPFGKCLCGQAALTRKVQFVNSLDSRHTTHYDGITQHGHYCVSIIFADKLLGVLNLYLKKGHAYNQDESDSLSLIAESLAGLIMRKRAEDELEVAYKRLKEAQYRLIQAEKMQVVGSLASGLAHEVKNPLAIITMGLDYISKSVADNQKLSAVLDNTRTAVERADSIIRGLLDLSRPARLEIKPCNLNYVLDKALKLAKHSFDKNHIRVIRDFKNKDSYAILDENKIVEVLLNIFLNAVNAMPDGGELAIVAYEKKFTKHEEGVGRRVSDRFGLGETAVVIEIQDTGGGITKDILDKIFDPFFTTRREKGGTGLGLSIVKNIIDMHGGLIIIRNKSQGHGIIVTLMLRTQQKGG